MIQFRFEKKFGSWYWMADDKIRYMTDELAFAFDTETGTLFKHGDPEKVGEWLADAQRKFREAGQDDIASDWVMISSSEWDEETVNKFIHITGFIKIWAEKECPDLLNKVAPKLTTDDSGVQCGNLTEGDCSP